VLAGNDEIAYGLWRALSRRGSRCRTKISLVGFDDREESGFDDPPLSTVRRPQEEIGETCMKMLLERLHHPQMAFSQRVLPTELIIGKRPPALPALDSPASQRPFRFDWFGVPRHFVEGVQQTFAVEYGPGL